jgi:hypothetical protein
MSTAVKRERVGLVVERDDAERMSADDQATARDAEFLADALLAQRLAASRAGPLPRGVCANCAEVCLPLAVYCDDECRADHEVRLAAERRQGRAR